jgi:hypothetical protein
MFVFEPARDPLSMAGHFLRGRLQRDHPALVRDGCGHVDLNTQTENSRARERMTGPWLPVGRFGVALQASKSEIFDPMTFDPLRKRGICRAQRKAAIPKWNRAASLPLRQLPYPLRCACKPHKIKALAYEGREVDSLGSPDFGPRKGGTQLGPHL